MDVLLLRAIASAGMSMPSNGSLHHIMVYHHLHVRSFNRNVTSVSAVSMILILLFQISLSYLSE
jgi:hypothetical protein